jgi:arylsulfatase A-like enzyme
VLLYVIDTLRADHLGVYGYSKPVSPHLDALAAESVVFERAYAQSGWTRTSMASILTGVTPFAHHVLGRNDALPTSLPTLAGLLRSAGYNTAGIVTNANVAPELGFGRGFDRYRPLYSRHDDSPAAGRLNGELLAWLQSRRRQGAPFFAYLHSLEPHDPYEPPEPFRSRFAPHLATALYDGEIAANDAAFGRLLQSLREAGLYDDTLIVVVSDHGEELLDHGRWGHGHTLYTEILHVPLILKLPPGRRAGERRHNVARQIDLLPTILAAVGEPVPTEAQGRDLLAPTAGEADPPVLSQLRLDRVELASLVDRGRKLIQWNPDSPPGHQELYDLRDDPQERRDLTAQGPRWASLMTSRLRQLRSDQERSVTVPRVILDGEVRHQLRALGYIR